MIFISKTICTLAESISIVIPFVFYGGAGILGKVHFSGAQKNYRIIHSFLLAYFWISGIIFGLLLFAAADSDVISWIRCIPDTTVTLMNLLFVTLIPFMLSIAADCLHVIYLLYPVCFIKALGTAFVYRAIWGAFGNAGWIIGFFLLFHDIFSLPILYFYWLRCLRNGAKNFNFGYTIFLLSAVVLIVSIDIRVILPFGARFMGKFVGW